LQAQQSNRYYLSVNMYINKSPPYIFTIQAINRNNDIFNLKKIYYSKRCKVFVLQ
jgi:hypothetical protein